jgi:hypothetical protein
MKKSSLNSCLFVLSLVVALSGCQKNEQPTPAPTAASASADAVTPAPIRDIKVTPGEGPYGKYLEVSWYSPTKNYTGVAVTTGPNKKNVTSTGIRGKDALGRKTVILDVLPGRFVEYTVTLRQFKGDFPYPNQPAFWTKSVRAIGY